MKWAFNKVRRNADDFAPKLEHCTLRLKFVFNFLRQNFSFENRDGQMY